MPKTVPDLMRPLDADLFRLALRSVHRQTGVPLAFAGRLTDRSLVLSEFLGARTDQLRGLRVEAGKGVGGTVLASGRPHAVKDYRTAHDITHDYDAAVLGEGIFATVGVPVTVQGTVRGVLYAAVRSDLLIGDRATDSIVGVARKVAAELSVRDEVDRRLHLMDTAGRVAEPAESAPLQRDNLLELRAELRSIVDEMGNDLLRNRLQRACERLSGLDAPSPEPSDSLLAPREIDVLKQIALGCNNAEVAQQLSLRPETVKAYLRNATRKLGVSGRHQAVLTARREGIIT